jgi:hypothetical protein
MTEHSFNEEQGGVSFSKISQAVAVEHLVICAAFRVNYPDW